ncbi:MAG: aldolase/citrate lyase family protein [Dehalococcoidia bacterium]|jgi:4-hydroxy-2-oxoheptanedioate aldolase|nr:aldolase/citrate lyase family protein [Dehalococcoidia bacterium]
MTRIRTNNILAKNREGKKGLGLGLVFPCAEAIELVGMMGGFDHVNLDGEHGLFSPESIDAMVRVANGYGLTVTARVPNLTDSTINQFLDRGVMGVLGPHVDTAEHANQLVDSCRFVPEGDRSWGGGAGTFYNDGGLLDQPGSQRTEWMVETNKEMLVMAQLETATAFENLDSILAVDGIDAFAWGSNDLAQSMGLPGQPDHPDVKAAEASVADRIHAAGRKMSSDLTAVLGLPNLILDGARAFLDAQG